VSHQIDSIVPNHGNPGDTVVINGSGFGAVQGASQVRFAPNEVATVSLWTATALTVIVPATATTGTVRVIVTLADAVSPRNADFWNLDAIGYPTTLDDIEFQNTKNDSDVGGLDDLVFADARDYNTLADYVRKLAVKVGIDGSLDPNSLDFQVSGPVTERLVISEAELVPAGAVPPPLPFAAPVVSPPVVGLHSVLNFLPGVDLEVLIRFTVPSLVRPGSVLTIIPVFTLSAPPPPSAVTLELAGDLDGTALPPIGIPGNYPVGGFPFGGPPFFVGPLLRTIPVDGAPPFAPASSSVALRFKRLGTVGDTYPGAFQLAKVFVDWVR
jgi:hypothetical protein